MKKMMAFVLGLLCAVCLPLALPQTQVQAESANTLVVAMTTSTSGTDTVKITVKITENPGICVLKLHLKSTSAFTVSSTGNNLSSLTYEGLDSTGIYTWGPAEGSVNTTTIGKIMTLTLKLKSSTADGSYKIYFDEKTALYNDGTSQFPDRTCRAQFTEITVQDGKIAETGTADESTGLPTWAVILIAVGGVAIVGGITFGIIKSKKKTKTWTQIR